MLGFNLLAALMALVMLARHGRAAVGLLRARGTPGRPPGAVMALLNCLVALAVLAMAVRGLVEAAVRAPPGG